MRIRPEAPGDFAAVARLLERAFDGPAEARLVEALRAAGDAAVALVAEAEGAILGHVMLSPMAAPFPALGLAPLAVLPERQGAGVGGALARAALAAAEAAGWRAVFVVGDPAYYRRFGFAPETAVGFASPYAGPHFMALALGGPLPATEGAVGHAPAFSALG